MFNELWKWLFLGLIPPLEGHTPAEKRWRICMSLMTTAAALGLVVAVLYNAEDVQHYARETDVAALQQSNNEIKVQIIAQGLYQTAKEQCEAKASGSSLAKAYTVQRLNELLTDYYRITGEQFRLPQCEEI